MKWTDRLLARAGVVRRSVAKEAVRTAAQRGVALGAKRTQRVYAGAQVTRLTADSYGSIMSADQEQRGALKRLRGEARRLERDNSYASRFLDILAENVVGHEGIQLQARKISSRGKLDQGLNKQLAAAWMRWGLPENCSLDQRLSWVDVQQLVIRHIARDGEVLLRMVEGADNEFSFAVQVLDVDLLDDEFSADTVPGRRGHSVHQGIEEDASGRVTHYHLWTQHPSEYGSGLKRREPVPAREILHLYVQRRVGQRRGPSWFAPIIVDLSHYDATVEAEVVATRIAASKFYTIERDPEFHTVPPKDEDSILDDVEPGQGLDLDPGLKLNAIDWNHPNTGLADFSRVILHSTAAGWSVSYATLTGDLRQVNYSSIRTGSITERDTWRRIQGWLAMHLHRRVFDRWVKFAALNGHVPAREVSGWLDVDWKGRGWKWVDPVKDGDAAAAAVHNGFNTRSNILAEQGLDFEDVIDRLAEEAEYARQAGVQLPTVPAKATGTQPQDNDDDSGTGDGGRGDDRAGASALSHDPRRAAGIRLARGL